MFIKDKVFIDLVVYCYKELWKGVLVIEYLFNYIDEIRYFLGLVIDWNYKKWGYVFDLKNIDLRNYLIFIECNVISYYKLVE